MPKKTVKARHTQNQDQTDREQKTPNNAAVLPRRHSLNFPPLNPGNSRVRRPEDFVPIYESTPARKTNLVSGKDVLWISGQRSRFPMMDNSGASLGENDQRNSLFKIHQELCGNGYEMSVGDIRRTFPLNTTATQETKITTVVIYKDAKNRQRSQNRSKEHRNMGEPGNPRSRWSN